MTIRSGAFLQATFHSTPLFSKTLIFPLNVSVASPDGRSWKSVTDDLLSCVGSKKLLDMVASELIRTMNLLALEHINGWIFQTDRAMRIKEVLEAASCRYARIRDGIFAREVKEALKNLFLTDPRFQARLSKSDDLDEAVCEVQGRVLSQCRFSWGMMIFSPVDWRAEGIRLMSLMQQEIYSRTAHLGDDAQMMSAQRFKRLTAFYERFSQFAGLDPRFDRALADMRKLLSALPDDAAYLYGGGLKDFWAELTRLGDYLTSELQSDFNEEPSLADDFDEDALRWDIASEDLIDDCIEWDQCGLDIAPTPDITGGFEIGTTIGNNSFDIGLSSPSLENFSLTPSPKAF